MLAERLFQPGIDALPHPGQRLLLATRGELAMGLLQPAEFRDGLPEGIDAGARQLTAPAEGLGHMTRVAGIFDESGIVLDDIGVGTIDEQRRLTVTRLEQLGRDLLVEATTGKEH